MVAKWGGAGGGSYQRKSSVGTLSKQLQKIVCNIYKYIRDKNYEGAIDQL